MSFIVQAQTYSNPKGPGWLSRSIVSILFSYETIFFAECQSRKRRIFDRWDVKKLVRWGSRERFYTCCNITRFIGHSSKVSELYWDVFAVSVLAHSSCLSNLFAAVYFFFPTIIISASIIDREPIQAGDKVFAPLQPWPLPLI